MISYSLGILPLIQDLQMDHPDVTQPCYADDDGAGGTFSGIGRHLDNLMVRGPPRGYFTEPNKSILVMSPWNSPRSESFFQGYGLQIMAGSSYLGGFMGTEVAQAWWLE